MCNSFKWHESADILSATADLRVHCWYYPAAIYVDKELMGLCKLVKEEPDIGRDCQITSFYGNNVAIKKKDGSQKIVSSAPYPQMLLTMCASGEWDRAIKLCRYIKEEYLWAILASISLGMRHIETAEISLANINSIDKVQFIMSLGQKSPIVRKGELLLYFKRADEAEELYLSKGMHYRAIKLNIKLYRWDRAVALVKKLKVHLDTLLAYRERYLRGMDMDETNDIYKQLKAKVGEYKWEDIKARIAAEKAKEQGDRQEEGN